MQNGRISTFADVLSVIAWSVVYPWGNGSTFELLHFMMGGRLTRREVPDVVASCRKFLLQQFPEFATLKMSKRIARLDDLISKSPKAGDKNLMINVWVKTLRPEYQDSFSVRPLPDDEASSLIFGFHTSKASTDNEEDVLPKESTG